MQSGIATKIQCIQFRGVLIQDSPILNISGAHGPYTTRIICKALLTDGSLGWSEVPCNLGVYAVLPQVVSIAEGVTAEIDPVQEMLQRVVMRSKELSASGGFSDTRGTASFDKGITNHVRAAIQMAVYDAMARSRGMPLCDLLAGERGRQRDAIEKNLYLFWVANTEGSGLSYPETSASRWANPFAALRDKPVLDIPTAVKFARAAVAHVMPGVKMLKWKCGVFDPDTELELFLALHAEFKGGIRFVPDPNAGMTVHQAIRFLNALKAGLGDCLPYAEDPVKGVAAMAEVHATTGVALGTNMCAADDDEHRAAVAKRAIQITLAGDPHYRGGSDLAVALSWMCLNELGIDFAQHSNSHLEISAMHTLHMGCAAAAHLWPFDTHYFPWQSGRGILRSPLQLEHGAVLRVPNKPGLGIDPDDELLGEMQQLFDRANTQGRRFVNRDDGHFADVLSNGWVRPENREDKWYMAGVPQRISA